MGGVWRIVGRPLFTGAARIRDGTTVRGSQPDSPPKWQSATSGGGFGTGFFELLTEQPVQFRGK